MSEDGATPASDPAPATDPVSDPAPAANDGFSIPEEYAEKSWASKIKSQEDLYKQIDNLDSMVGKRQTPSDDASDEEWDEFFGKIGKPESADKYELTDPELPEGFEVPEDFKSKAQNLMYEAGLLPKQADKLYQAFLREEMGVANANQEAMAERQAELDKQFDETTNELFGDKFDEVSAKVQNFIKGNVPESLIPEIQGLSDSNPKALAALIAAVNAAQNQTAEIKAKYNAEDGLSTGGQPSASGKDEVLKKLTEAKTKARKADPFSPDRKEADNEIQELRKQLQSFYN